uniref:Peroxidase n=1 Tax=Oryza barthii TaxID=65489 RepID=A0A0D3F2W7_9ORYZ
MQTSPCAMAVGGRGRRPLLLLLLLLAVALALAARARAQLSPGFYSASCPTVHGVVRQVMSQAVMNDTRAGAAVLRLFYHDCFVGGCDASVLLDDTPAAPVEAVCPATVSCADVLAIAARDSVNLVSHTHSTHTRARARAISAGRAGRGPEADISALVSAFAAKGLSSRDLAALSGAHTVGRASCVNFRTRVYCDANVSPAFASHQRQSCPASGGDAALAPLDSLTPDAFDNGYYRNLVAGAGLLHSDQELFNNGPVDSVVQLYSSNAAAFSSDFAASMIRLGNIGPLTGSTGEVRLNCRKVSSLARSRRTPDRSIHRSTEHKSSPRRDPFRVRVFLLGALLLVAVSCHGGFGGVGVAEGLSTRYYAKTCPAVESVVRSVMARAVAADRRMGASVLRLFFHDCFVNGCDGSVLLDDAPPGFTGEKGAGANAGSARGFEVVDAAKARVEAACRATVSCADVLALAARDAVALLGGPTWPVRLGRKDARTASQAAANGNLPGPVSSLTSLLATFAAKGLSARDMTALSGAHTVGRARCATFRGRLRRLCPAGTGGDGNLAPLDAETPDVFDNGYFRELTKQRGLLHSDQELFAAGGGGRSSSQDALVRKYAGNGAEFARDFAKAMVKMGNLAPAAGTPVEVRLNCRKPN